ncbi:iron-sulfur cluster biosynthesis family protein [Paenibacillus humicus]|uniref:iron-sulfur cluster biosynthesis family protein n=1 Tax=Paenibacillus humicus TaxID=412861 RepID=UPI003D2698F7
MKLTLDFAADRIIHELLGERPGHLRLVYDMEGCGCGMSGIPGLELVSEPGPQDIKVECDSYPIWIDRQQAIFFEEKLFLQGDQSSRTFRLEGVSQLYKANMRLADRREEANQK